VEVEEEEEEKKEEVEALQSPLLELELGRAEDGVGQQDVHVSSWRTCSV
jgi:hypothetical protein